MSNIIAHPINLPAKDFTQEELDLIKATVAKGATDSELKLFLYRCKNMGLDPLKPGQVHFVKYGSAPGVMIVGIDGFRAKAHRTGKLKGVQRGVLRDNDGRCIGAWCEVNRSDWQHPAREETPLSEYNTGKGNWTKMPETMIKKVAEAAALRMAFPDDLGGIYVNEEMDQAAPLKDVRPAEIQAQLNESSDAPAFETANYFDPHHGIDDYVCKVGKNKGKKIRDISTTDAEGFIKFYDGLIKKGERPHPNVTEYYDKLSESIALKKEIVVEEDI